MRILPGLDVRTDGGYVVAPPSLHASGTEYLWPLAPDEVDAAPCPAWLLEHLRQPGGSASRSHDDWRELVANGVPEGERNSSVAALAGHLLAHRIDGRVCLGLLTAWDMVRNRPPLGPAEVEKTMLSIAQRELSKRKAVRHGRR